MDRLAFLRAQPWLEEDAPPTAAHTPAAPPLRTAEQAFASHEIYEGIATFALAAEAENDAGEEATADSDSLPASRRLAFRASLLASKWETRIRLALQPDGEDAGALAAGWQRHCPVPRG